MSDIIIDRITEVTSEVFMSAQRLAPYLASSNQVDLSVEYLQQIVRNPDNYWLVARTREDE